MEAVRCHRNMKNMDICPICSGVEGIVYMLLLIVIWPNVFGPFDDELVEHMIGCKNLDVKLWLLHLNDHMREEKFIKVLVLYGLYGGLIDEQFMRINFSPC